MSDSKHFSVEVVSGGFVVCWDDPLTPSEQSRGMMSYPPQPERDTHGKIIFIKESSLMKWLKEFL